MNHIILPHYQTPPKLSLNEHGTINHTTNSTALPYAISKTKSRPTKQHAAASTTLLSPQHHPGTPISEGNCKHEMFFQVKPIIINRCKAKSKASPAKPVPPAPSLSLSQPSNQELDPSRLLPAPMSLNLRPPRTMPNCEQRTTVPTFMIYVLEPCCHVGDTS